MIDTKTDKELGSHHHLLETAWICRADPDDCDLHWANTRDRSRLNDHIEALKSSILASSQLSPAIAITSPDDPDRYRLLTGGCRSEAVRRARTEGRDIDLVLLIVDCDDDVAAEIVYVEQAKTKAWSAWEFAEHLDLLVGQFGSNKKVAHRIGLDATNIGRNRNITALPVAFLDLVEDKHEISAAAASEFMRAWRGDGRPVLETHIAGLPATGELLDAQTLFENCAEALAIGYAKTGGDDVSVAHLLAIQPQLFSDEEDDDVEVECPAEADRAAGMEPVRIDPAAAAARRMEARLEKGERQVDVILPDDEIIGTAIRRSNDAFVTTISSPANYALDDVATAILDALQRLYIQ